MENQNASKAVVAPWKTALAQAESKMGLLIQDPMIVKKELGFALQAVQTSEYLQKCSPDSILDAVLNIARTGLTLSPIYKFAYLIPRKGKAVLDISYQGMCKVLVDSGGFKYIDAHVIYKDEVDAGKFNFNPGTGELHYDPIYPETEAEQNSRKMHGVLTIAVLGDGTRAPLFTPKWKIEKSRRISEGSGGQYSPWKNFEDEMYKKTAIRFHYKTLPKGKISEQLEAVLSLDEKNNPVDFSKGKLTSIADDILTRPEDANTEVPDTEESGKPKIELNASLRDKIAVMKDAKGFVAYVNGLTPMHSVPEFQEAVKAKATELKVAADVFTWLK